MKEKYLEIIQQLKLESLLNGNEIEGEIISGSMKLLLNIGDKFRVKKVDIKKINLGDLIIYRGEKKPIVHRVIWKFRKYGKYYFITKGDGNIFPDKIFVNEKDVFGKVIFINKRWVKIDLNRLSGKIISLIYFVTSYFYSLIVYLLKLRKRVVEKKISNRLNNKFLSFDIKISDWKNLVEKVKIFLSDKIGDGIPSPNTFVLLRKILISSNTPAFRKYCNVLPPPSTNTLMMFC
jgi:signal peptidase I